MTARQARLHSIPAAAEQLGIGRSHLYVLMGAGRLRFVKVGKRRLIPEDAITEFIAALSAQSVDA
ncbi:excisionase family DNA-binding protein [Nocardia sp. alder85J]|uniref:excisionase family DNA-binding protein n=1 Tax=Nocardia sp. alder85J TaxID=2862949 RepID=UPI001CD55AAF|nr:excisionase family DNA-binding protein [Nocardia sp. alder85J]MCX4097610.1 excisionase family DNA-binding protein [Nocardia sp. alder85J]